MDDEDVTADRVMIGSKIVIFDMEFSEKLSYKIVGSTEANSIKGKISNESPVGKEQYIPLPVRASTGSLRSQLPTNKRLPAAPLYGAAAFLISGVTEI